MSEPKRKVSDAERRAALNAMCDRIDALPLSQLDPLSRVKAIVAETLKHPAATEKDRFEILTEMENGGYEALMRMLMNMDLTGFNPNDRPWNRQ